jgi:hypothetical protein
MLYMHAVPCLQSTAAAPTAVVCADILAAFARYCCCCSGTITVDEMRDGLRAKGSKIPESELQRIMENADVNGEPAAAARNAAARTPQPCCLVFRVAALQS